MILVPGMEVDPVAAFRASQTRSFVHIRSFDGSPEGPRGEKSHQLLLTSLAIFAEPVAARAGAPLILRYVTTRRARIVVVMHAVGG